MSRSARLVALARTALALLVAVAVTGCMSYETTLTIRPDGSGTISEQLLVKQQFAQMMASMDTASSGGKLFTEAKVRDRAESRGGLTVESVEMISDARGEGYRSTYSFANINDINFNPSPDDMLPGNEDMKEQGAEVGSAFSDMKIEFEPGSPATLRLLMPEDDDVDDAMSDDAMDSDGAMPGSDDSDEIDEQQMRMMQMMMADTGFRVSIEVDGEIVETNASHRDGNRVTVLNFDLGTLSRDTTALRTFLESSSGDDMTEEELAGLPGMQFETKEDVFIRFR
jgi:hypothetical protein